MSGDPLHDRLRRMLHRAAPAEIAHEDDATRDRVRAALARRARVQPRAPDADLAGIANRRASDACTAWLEAALRRGEGADAPLARETIFTLDHLHGDWRLEEIHRGDSEVYALLGKDSSLAHLDLGESVYLDTETTGLSGGAGTYVFLVGLGTFEGDRFRVWQGFLPGPAEERVLLEAAAARIAARPSIVSFFGKSFDRHRLEDKMRCHGVAAPFADRAHLDLFHPLRRLYGGAFADTRLCTLESELCGVAREHDLPGSEAPRAWFDYVYGRPHALEGVFRHNLLDVLSLVVLAAHLGRSLSETRAEYGERRVESIGGPPDARARGIAAAYAAARLYEPASPWFDTAVVRTVDARGEAYLDDPSLKTFRALHARTRRQLERRAQPAGSKPMRPTPTGSKRPARRSSISRADRAPSLE